MAANVQGILEWLHANGVGVGWLAGLLGVPGFPADAPVTRQWFVGFDWWWWRSSRVVEDLSLAGSHIEVIDEFPAFSYLLGDNHPHVTAMPFVLLVIALALNLFLAPASGGELATGVRKWWERVSTVPSWGVGGYAVLAVVLGSLIPLNTWDFPPYWLLVVVALAAALMRRGAAAATGGGRLQAIVAAGTVGIVLLIAAWLLYLPYFLTAQSQASGIALNLFYPTHLGQFTAMFGTALLTLLALVRIAWAALRPRLPVVIACAALVLGLPLLLLASGGWLSLNTARGRALLAEVPLPEGADGHLRFMLERWLGSPYTFILTGLLLAVVAVLAWRAVTVEHADADVAEPATGAKHDGVLSLAFVLVLAGLGLLWVFAPEVVYLRDNFGTRMNTIFKFYYQAWLLFGLAGAYTIVVALARPRLRMMGPAILSGSALVLVAASLVYLGAGVYSKTGGFAGPPTFDATAYLAASAPDEWNAVRWLQENTLPGDVVVEGKGRSYGADTNRASTMTGRATLLGWDGHEAQWRGRAYGEMAAGRPAALEAIYRDGAAEELRALFAEYGVDYVYVGPAERAQYGTTIQSEARLAPVADLVFSSGDVRIYRVR
jgi:YYY domain-containing protein